jgi:hypothetical protein
MRQKDAKVIASFVIGDIQPTSYSYVDKSSKDNQHQWREGRNILFCFLDLT